MGLVVVLAMLCSALAAPASAANRQVGDNASDSRQGGASRSGDAVGGPGLVVVHEGDLSLEMHHAPRVERQVVRSAPGELRVVSPSRPVAVRSGDAFGSNRASTFVGLSMTSATLVDVFAFAVD